MLQLAYRVSTGTELFGRRTEVSDVLYLALEDDYRRLQERLYRMFGADGANGLFIANSSAPLGNGLLSQLYDFLGTHPFVRLIIIDTLAMVRDKVSENYSYSTDYALIKELKDFADANQICLLLVHHTRKMQSDDKFDMISGTNGLLGAADGAFVLYKEKRTAGAAVLEVSGRDQPDQKLYLKRDPVTLGWELEKAEVEEFKPLPEPLLEAIAKLVTPEAPDWSGTPTELAEALGTDLSPRVLSYKLNINNSRLLAEHDIHYSAVRTNGPSLIGLHYMVSL
jgi:RecA-family ATPase